MKQIRSLLLSLLLFASYTSIAYSDGRSEIWLAPLDPLVRPFNGTKGSIDYIAAFSPDAQWATVAAHTKVIKLYPQLVTTGTDSDLARVLMDLKRRHIAVAIEFGVLTDTETCGRAVEGYYGEALARVAERIKRLGGELKYLAMDEPLWYGSHYNGKNACHATIDEIAKDAAENIRNLRAVAPNIEIGDIEPLAAAGHPKWNEEIAQWTEAFRLATGRKLGFLHADVMWNEAWKGQVSSIADYMRTAGIAFGIIYNGNSEDMSDVNWIDHAEKHYLEYEAGHNRPDHAIFQSWTNFPTHFLPETSAYTMTGLVKGYLRSPSNVELNKSQKAIAMRLTSDSGRPIAGGTLLLESQKKTGLGKLAHTRLSGIVPSAAHSALFGVRINMECSCQGESVLGLKATRYKEFGDSPSVERDFSAGFDGWQVAGAAVHEIVTGADHARILRIEAHPSQGAMVNSASFKVTPGATFEADFQLQVQPGSEGSGYSAVIFLDPGGKEIARARLPLQTPWATTFHSVTDAAGRVALPLATFRGDTSIRVIFPGDDQHRPTRILFP